MPEWSKHQEEWWKVIQCVTEHYPDARNGFIHRDYHPCNVLWEDGRLTGVVDWVNACIGPAGVDAGHCSLNLALLYGADDADFFLNAY
ncbi:aminoglycoside phosphotransferase family protein [Fictibacillus sp. Mic-4]|uniref:aminoglycoside phosphotransferase family protein n=1 Tax=Fictibacillus sp. Mic-4 TaxID=3132826 RepID=UPI003CEB0B0B